MKGVNERVRLVGVGAVALIVVLFAMLNYLQIFHANALDNNPHNTRGIISEYEQPRGAILSADGVTLAQSVPSNDQYKYQRVYPTGALFGQITGYFSLTYGTDGLESQYNSALTEADTPITLPANIGQVKKFFTTQPTPDNLQITVLSKLQQVAATELAGRDGAVVALNPKTGAILAMYANPSYNPNPLSSHNELVQQNAWEALQNDPGDPLLSAAYRQRFFPGSTFKIVTAAAVYDHKRAAADQALPVASGFVLPDTEGQVLHNFGGEACGGNLLELFTVSCDTGFAQLGLAVGATNLANEATAVRVGRDPAPRPARRGAVVLPTRLVIRPKPGRPGEVRHRPGERPGHPAHDRPRRRGSRRWRRHHDPALVGKGDQFPGPDGTDLQAEAVAHGHFPRNCQEAHQPDALRRQQPERDGRRGADPGCAGGGQNRDRSDGWADHRDVVRRFRPGA